MPEQMHKSVASESAWAREFKGWLSLFHQGFFFLCAHFKLSDFVGCRHSCLFIYLLSWCPKDAAVTFVLLFYFIFFIPRETEEFWSCSSDSSCVLCRALGWVKVTDQLQQKAHAGSCGLLEPFVWAALNQMTCVFFFFFFLVIFFFLNSDQYVQLPPLRPFASLLRMLLFLFSQWLRWMNKADW